MKHQANKNRSERSFEVGDKVYLKLQPFIQTSVAARGNNKLSFCYYGHYTILARVGSIAYKLELPDDAKIHLVIHMSQLKKHVPASVPVESDLSQFPTDPKASISPSVVH